MMKRRRKQYLKRKRKRAVIGLVLITLMAMGVVCISVWAKSYAFPGTENNNTSSDNIEQTNDDNRVIKIRDSEEGLDDDMLEPIMKYFETYFESMANLDKTDITQLFKVPSSENAWINQSAMDYLIDLRLNQSNDLTMINYECGLTITEVKDSGDLIEVVLLEDHTVNFAFIPEVDSSSSGIIHTFYLEAAEDSYQITKHYKEEDSFLMIEEAIDESYGEPQEVADNLLNESLAVIKELAAEKESFNMDGEETWQDQAVDNEYDSEAAVDYAMTWVDPIKVIRNDDDFGVYDSYGGNCNNYISQCLNAGGIPMDSDGYSNEQWKWYGEEIDDDQSDTGRSPSWTGVNEFYNYANENEGYGLEALVDENVYSGSIGDVLQYGHDDEWLHSVIITDVVKDSDGDILDYLINSNTTDRINYPASAYGYSELRLIKILGWNDSE